MTINKDPKDVLLSEEDKILESTGNQNSQQTEAPSGKVSPSPATHKGISSEPDDDIYDEYLDDEDAMDEEELERMYTESLKHIEEGEVVKGTILRVMDEEVLVDIGYKSEGTISLREFRTPTGELNVNVGDVVDVFLETMEDSDDLIVLSKEKADKIKIWDDLIKIYENGETIEGKVTKRIKGGLTVDIGIPGFLPGSQIDIKPIRDLDGLIGKVLKMKIIKLNKKRGNIVLSRRSLLEEERDKKRKVALETIEEGKLVKGIVKNITEYGAFIDLGGIDGLLHVTDMSWGRVRHPSELFVVGDEVEVMVLKFDQANERISLGLKQKTPDPWEKVDEKYVIGSRVRGKVVSLTDYGAFVELEEGVEGLIHVSEMSWTRKIRHPSRVVAIGEIVEVIVLDVDKENKRISLGMKQTEPNPWLIIESKYQVGSKITGRVRNITDFGAFIELEEGVDGLVHISDISWTQRIKHPSEVLKKGEKIDAVILSIDTQNERLSLGIKQLQPDPWSKVEEKYPVGSIAQCRIIRLTDTGAVAELEGGVDGFIHVSEMGKDEMVNNPKQVLSIGDEIMVKIIRTDVDARKIGLSIRGYEEAASSAELEEYRKSQKNQNDTTTASSSAPEPDASSSDSDDSPVAKEKEEPSSV
ncbi:MAG: 30S ribosomal protein S1 [bacterium]